MIGAIEEALEETEAKFGHLVASEKTADAINESFVKDSDERGAAKRPNDEEEWAIRSRAQVTTFQKSEDQGKQQFTRLDRSK